MYRQGDGKLTFAKEEDRGYIDSLNFKSELTPLKWEYDAVNPDICVIYLNTPLRNGDRVRITTPFKVKIPSGEISRMGHIGQSYQITQWYPKPAVYDKNGWNAIPYLNQGEFYSEYGSYDVSITLPKNYIVGATGDLHNRPRHQRSRIKMLTAGQIGYKKRTSASCAACNGRARAGST